MVAHRYWRITLDANFGGGDFGATEIRMCSVIGGPTVTGSGVASASSIYNGTYPASNAFDGTSNAWFSLGTGQPAWIGYDFGAGNAFDIVEIDWQAPGGGYAGDAPSAGWVQFSDDGAAFTNSFPFEFHAFSDNETQSAINAPTTMQRVPEARVFSIFSLAAAEMRASEARTFSIIGFPAISEQVSAARSIIAVKRDSVMELAEARVFAIVKGRTANPRVRAWTFTFDGHDFYVLRLGDDITLVYDTSSEQWVEWDSVDSGAWRPNIGTNWIGAQALANTYGSSIIAGDDTFGLLWFLDPNLPYDQTPDLSRPTTQYPFDRIVTGQVLAKGRQFLPCYAIFLDGDNYGLSVTEFTPVVVLETSDDQGRTWDAHDTLTVPADYDQQNAYEWTSLGQISSPGRLFRITDNGVFTRLDTMSMNDDAG